VPNVVRSIVRSRLEGDSGGGLDGFGRRLGWIRAEAWMDSGGGLKEIRAKFWMDSGGGLKWYWGLDEVLLRGGKNQTGAGAILSETTYG